VPLAVGHPATGPGTGEVDGPAQVEVDEEPGAVRPGEDPPHPTEERYLSWIPANYDPTVSLSDLLIGMDPPVAADAEIDQIDHRVLTPTPLWLPMVHTSSRIPIRNSVVIPSQNHSALFAQTLRALSDGILRGIQALSHGAIPCGSGGQISMVPYPSHVMQSVS
jgi:hypothetical protein